MDLKQFLKGKDRKNFAIQLGTTKNYINLLVCRARRPSPDLALRISELTGIPVMDLLFRKFTKGGR
jgi:plasmid maintenance system antidote protein VapI